jgi:hypothetical protein
VETVEIAADRNFGEAHLARAEPDGDSHSDGELLL